MGCSLLFSRCDGDSSGMPRERERMTVRLARLDRINYRPLVIDFMGIGPCLAGATYPELAGHRES